jgi:hypothetical protein
MDLEKIKNHPRVELRKRLVSLHKITKGSYLKYSSTGNLSLYSKDGIKIAKLVTDCEGDSYIKFNNSMSKYF